ncbi:hypothetical protein [Arthrobacter sp. A5]|uniref:hypothetical protein n=1 Tax=Arthrobacter sp. A5 TaxID=576926 RepID=UPI003DA7B521
MSNFTPPLWITSADDPDDEYFSRRLSLRAKAGELMRVRQGLYLPTPVWKDLKPWEQYRMRIEAVHRTARSAPIFCHRASAQVWGIPVITIPALVDTFEGRSGGGHSGAGVYRHRTDLSKVCTAQVDGLTVTSKLQTARDLAVVLPFPEAVAAMDRILSPRLLVGEQRSRPIQKSHMEISMKLLPHANYIRRVERVLAFADGLSGSPGESLSRAHMVQFGFPAPELQHEVRDGQGRIGYTDFYWKELGLVGEFDGWVKYSRGEFLAGDLPADALWKEKVREDRIRDTGLRVTRWMWTEVSNPELLRQRLLGAGLRPL